MRSSDCALYVSAMSVLPCSRYWFAYVASFIAWLWSRSRHAVGRSSQMLVRMTVKAQRASQWTTMGPLLATAFEDDLDFQVGAALMQSHLDPWDSINFVDHLVSQRFEGRDPVRVVLHEAVEDAQVNNMVTHWVARTAGIPVFSPNTLEPYGLETLPPEAHDGPAALYIYDEGYPPLPVTNTPPVENGAHGSVRELDVYKEHVTAFIETGDIVYGCEDACDPD